MTVKSYETIEMKSKMNGKTDQFSCICSPIMINPLTKNSDVKGDVQTP